MTPPHPPTTTPVNAPARPSSEQKSGPCLLDNHHTANRGNNAPQPDLPARIARVGEIGNAILENIEHVIAGKRDVAEIAVACLLSRGHLLVEDLPGVGKTLLAQTLAATIGGSFRRIQGTIDLLPGDVTGTLMPERDPNDAHIHLNFRPGPVFANVVVFDELNRTNPRTQSALLEAAEENTVTVDGVSHALPSPFFVVATQNPLDIAGTFPLGEGAADRFAAVISPGRASPADEVAVLTGRRGRRQLADTGTVVNLTELADAQESVREIAVSDTVAAYLVDLLEATRHHPEVRLGASTRGGLAVIGLAKAVAALDGRGFITSDDIKRVAVAGLAHRITTGRSEGVSAGRHIVTQCLASVPAPKV
jgi:MoxR-like ATPase